METTMKNISEEDQKKLSKRDQKLVSELQIGNEPEIVKNRFSGEPETLQPLGVALYDYIMGCEVLNDYKGMQKGLTLFRKLYPSEYMTLLD